MSGNRATEARSFDSAKRPGTILSGPYGHPMHTILVTVPIGAWLAAFILVILGLLALSVSGWLGGKMAYHFGVRVAHETDRLEAYK
jgi:uncharacterized membrane protein